MGVRTESIRLRLAGEQAQAQTTGREAELRKSEGVLGEEERLLGTERQVTGLSSDPIEAFRGRFSLNETLAGSFEVGKAEKRTRGANAMFRQNLAEANTIMDKAEDAARSGDLETAERLKISAHDAVKGGPAEIRARILDYIGPGYMDVFEFGVGSPRRQAEANLSSPISRTVGKIVQQGREFLDPTSKTTKEVKESLTGDAIKAAEAGRVTALQEEGASERELIKLSGARSVSGKQALAARAHEMIGEAKAQIETTSAQEKAEIHASASQYLTNFRYEFAQKSVATAQDFLQNKSGSRESFTTALNSLTAVGADYSLQRAGQAAGLSEAALDRANRSKYQSRAIFSMAFIGISTAIGAAIGSIWGQTQMGAKIGRKVGETYDPAEGQDVSQYERETEEAGGAGAFGGN